MTIGTRYSGKKVSAIIPTRNEAGGIASVIEGVRPFVNEIIVVDGHSTDGTLQIAKEAGAITLLDNKIGKGDAYQVGIENATGDIIVFIDADGSHEPNDIPAIIEPILNNEAELVIASRHKGGSDEWRGDLMTWLRAIGSGFLSVCINFRWKSNLTDVLNGFRAADTKVAKTIKLKAVDFDVEQHMIVQFLKRSFRVTEVGSHEYERGWGHSKLPTLHKAHIFFWRLFLDLFSTNNHN